jgi:hypothetical protein
MVRAAKVACIFVHLLRCTKLHLHRSCRAQLRLHSTSTPQEATGKDSFPFEETTLVVEEATVVSSSHFDAGSATEGGDEDTRQVQAKTPVLEGEVTTDTPREPRSAFFSTRPSPSRHALIMLGE